MNIVESTAVAAAIESLKQRNYHAMHGWVWSNPDKTIIVGWDGDNEIDIAERAIQLGSAAAKSGVTTIIRADIEGSTFFFLEDEATVIALVDSL